MPRLLPAALLLLSLTPTRPDLSSKPGRYRYAAHSTEAHAYTTMFGTLEVDVDRRHWLTINLERGGADILRFTATLDSVAYAITRSTVPPGLMPPLPDVSTIRAVSFQGTMSTRGVVYTLEKPSELDTLVSKYLSTVLAPLPPQARAGAMHADTTDSTAVYITVLGDTVISKERAWRIEEMRRHAASAPGDTASAPVFSAVHYVGARGVYLGMRATARRKEVVTTRMGIKAPGTVRETTTMELLR
jgi:hypothetical protein